MNNPSEETESLVVPPVSHEALSSLTLRSGYTIEAQAGGPLDSLQIRAPNGRLCLKIVLGPEGAHIELSGASMSIAARGDIKLDCERLEISTKQELALRSAGDVICAAGEEVMIDGKLIRLNSPRGERSP